MRALVLPILVPLSTAAFSTLAPHYRNEGTSMFSLIRNLGSSIGIAVVINVLSHEAQTSHAEIANSLGPFRAAMDPAALPGVWDWGTSAGAAALNAEVTRQALMIAYVNDFRLMMYLTLSSIPLLVLLRAPRAPARPAARA